MSTPGNMLFLAGVLGVSCGGQAVEDAGSGGVAPGSGGVSMFGSGGGAGGGTAVGGGVATGGVGGGKHDCNDTTIECIGGWCTCPGVFADCSYGSVDCEPDPQGEPTNCVCGDPTIGADDCEYHIQHRCEPPEAIAWLKTCTCDPVLPTDDEPCRYHQEMYDRLGEDRTCTMAVADIEPNEKYKYSCFCGPSD